MFRYALILSLVLGTAACSSSSTSERECDPGDVTDCTCDDGASGTRSCLEDGSGWGVCDCASQAPIALTEVPPPGEPIDAPFPFLDQSDEVSEAMKSLWEHGMRAPATSEEMSAAMAARDEAIETVEANLPAVQAELLTALQSIEGDDLRQYITLVPLLQVAGDSAPILTHFQGIAMRELSAEEQEAAHDPSDIELLRGLAMQMLAHQAKRGSELARTHMLRAVTSPAIKVRKDAVRYTYQVVKSRRLAQRELRSRMSPEDRYLLYLY